jgi:hypothetical protein
VHREYEKTGKTLLFRQGNRDLEKRVH